MTSQPAERKTGVLDTHRLQLLNLTGELLCITDANGHVKYVNPAWERAFGHGLNDMIDKPVTDLVHPDDHRAMLSALESADPGTVELENQCRGASGAYRRVRWTCVRNPRERLVYAKACMLEPEADALREPRERLAALAEVQLAINKPHELQATLDGICQLTTRLLPASGGASILLWDASQEAFVTSSSTVPDQDPQTAAHRARPVGGATRWIVDHCQPLVVTDIRHDPFTANPMLYEARNYAYAGVPLMNADRAIGVLYAMDRNPRTYSRHDVDFMTDLANRAAVAVVRVQLYEELRLSNRLLARSQRELRAKNQELARSNKELEDFAYIVSHDLKVPLRGINQLAQWISADQATRLDRDGREQLTLLQERARHMNDLIDGILSYSRVGREQQQLTEVDLHELVAEVGKLLADPAGATLQIVGRLPAVHCQATQMRQVFQNLIGNAVKYANRPDSRVTVRCTEQEQDWRLTVADNGPGIDPRHFERIFKMFQRAVPAGCSAEGTGVGLSLAKKILELHGGRIWVESDPGQGCRFHFTLPKSGATTSNHEQGGSGC